MSEGQDVDGALVAQLETIESEECLTLLAGTSLGRLGLLVDGRPEIFPVNYAVDEDVVLFRTGPGTVLIQRPRCLSSRSRSTGSTRPGRPAGACSSKASRRTWATRSTGPPSASVA